MFKVFLDANVIADTYDEKRHTCLDSQKALEILLGNSNVEIYTSCDIITTLYYILSKQGREIALDAIIYVNDVCRVIEFANKEIQESCQLMKENPHYKDLEDTIQYIMAKKISADLILSNDKGFVSDDIKLLTTPNFNLNYPKGIE